MTASRYDGEKVYCRYEKKHSQKEGHLGESRVNRTMRQAIKGEQGGETKRPGRYRCIEKNKKGQVTKNG